MAWRIAFVLLAAVAGVAASATTRAGTPAEAGPSAMLLPHTRSYYVATASHDAAAKLGCDNADTQGRMTLFFGAPTETQGQFGATLWGGSDRTARQAGELVQAFIRGYAWCRQSPGQQLIVGMGTSNSTIDRRNDLWAAGHGVEWATVARDVNGWAATYYPGVAQVDGAWDVEPSWSTYPRAEAWMRGYDSVPGRRGVHANFSADGCPRDSAGGGACNNGWNQHQLWRLAWQYDPALPMPQIYATSGVNARQWQKIDEYGARAQNDGMTFVGAMSQRGACLQMGGCAKVDNGPLEARDFLLQYLNGSPLTQQAALETTTDMHWHR